MEFINWEEKLLPYNQAVNELIVKFESLASGFVTLGMSSPIEAVEGRVKSVSSILSKAQKKGIPLHKIEEQIEDIAGIRIMCRFVEDIIRVVNLIKERDGLDMEVLKERDYVNNMKLSGYRSFHIIIRYPVVTALGKKYVFAELQIRTLAMNFWAIIEHSLRYKYDKQIPEAIHNRLIRSADAAFLLDKEVSEIRNDIIAAEQSKQTFTNIIDEIIKNIQNLYKIAKLDEVDALNRQFMTLYDEGDQEKLSEFGRQVKVMAELYKAQ